MSTDTEKSWVAHCDFQFVNTPDVEDLELLLEHAQNAFHEIGEVIGVSDDDVQSVTIQMNPGCGLGDITARLTRFTQSVEADCVAARFEKPQGVFEPLFP